MGFKRANVCQKQINLSKELNHQKKSVNYKQIDVICGIGSALSTNPKKRQLNIELIPTGIVCVAKA